MVSRKAAAKQLVEGNKSAESLDESASASSSSESEAESVSSDDESNEGHGQEDEEQEVRASADKELTKLGQKKCTDFKLSCLHDWNEEKLSSCLQNYLSGRKLRSDKKDSVGAKGTKNAEFTPWWDELTKPKCHSADTKKTAPKEADDTYESWFTKAPQDGTNWLCGPGPSTSSSAGQKSAVEDIEVPSIYDKKLTTKGRRALKRERKAEREKTLGKKWFGMKAPDVDEKMKNDMELIQMRGVLDPKRFYKHQDRKGLPKYFQMGTVVDEGTDFYSSRLTKKQRKQTLVEELMADANVRQYNKRKYAELQQKMRSKKKFKSKKT